MAEIVTKSHENIGLLAKNEKYFKKHMSVIKYYTSFKNVPPKPPRKPLEDVVTFID